MYESLRDVKETEVLKIPIFKEEILICLKAFPDE